MRVHKKTLNALKTINLRNLRICDAFCLSALCQHSVHDSLSGLMLRSASVMAWAPFRDTRILVVGVVLPVGKPSALLAAATALGSFRMARISALVLPILKDVDECRGLERKTKPVFAQLIGCVGAVV